MAEEGKGHKYFYMLIFMFLYRCGWICVMFSGELVNGIIVAEDSAKIVGPGMCDGRCMYKYTQRLEANFGCLPQSFSMIFLIIF